VMSKYCFFKSCTVLYTVNTDLKTDLLRFVINCFILILFVALNVVVDMYFFSYRELGAGL